MYKIRRKFETVYPSDVPTIDYNRKSVDCYCILSAWSKKASLQLIVLCFYALILYKYKTYQLVC